MNIADFIAGKVLLINKPYKWTSFDAVNKVKWIIRNNAKKNIPDGSDEKPPNLRVGHAGTLDPLATGLLIICTGKETKNIERYQAAEKEYTGTFFIGATTPCYDLEKPVDKIFPTEHITEEMIRRGSKKFIGTQMQTPPIFSAVMIDGKRAYQIARAGKTAEIKSREITIHSFEIKRISIPEVDFKIVCSKGTYIRAIARDLGEELKSGAHLTALCRTRIGNFVLKDSVSLEDFEKENLV